MWRYVVNIKCKYVWISYKGYKYKYKYMGVRGLSLGQREIWESAAKFKLYTSTESKL